MAPRTLRPRTALLMSLVLALLLGALAILVMFPAAQHLRSFQDGERVSATLHRDGSCMAGNCQVKFEVDGQPVVADLPVGSGGGKSSVGDRMIVRYQADDLQSAAREDDVEGGGAAVLALMSSGAAVFFLVLSVVGVVYGSRQRHQGP
ncbi:hypothetical protein [Streptomyces sp. NBC_00690]|uniref:hypothetical protein n=1 Tax=Streptomyces sp. NBC_00690 TaxID=2975808 RepID=UPI002E297340|nr:hypothetical protein [Streptomyces sp. NBC_00690]